MSRNDQVSETRRLPNGKGMVANFPGAVVWCLISLCSPVLAQAAEQAEPAATVIETAIGAGQNGASDARIGESRRPEVGMSLAEALALVGAEPDSQEEVGAACGMLDVLTWDEDGTQIISVDGTVTSIVDRSRKRP